MTKQIVQFDVRVDSIKGADPHLPHFFEIRAFAGPDHVGGGSIFFQMSDIVNAPLFGEELTITVETKDPEPLSE